MTLTIHTTEDEQRQLRVTVEVPEARVEKQMQATARELARGMQIPGFRKGKVPYQVLVKRLGYEPLRAEAVEVMLDDVYSEMLEQLEETPAGQPSLENLQIEPLVLDFIIPLEPNVALGDYRTIRREVVPVEITDEAVQEALEHLREHHEVVEPVSRAVMEGDMVTISGTGEVVEGDTVDVIFDEERMDMVADPERAFPGTDFVTNLIGMEVGDQGEFTIAFPEEEPYLPDDEDDTSALAGKQAQFAVTVLDVKSRYLPPLDDELAKAEGDYETLEELREATRERLQEQAEQEARNQLFDEVLDAMLEGAELVYPPSLVEDELDGMIENLKNQVTRAGWRWDDYVRLQSKTEELLREEWGERAEKNVRRSLVLRQFIRDEYIDVSTDEIQTSLSDRFGSLEGEGEVQQQLRDYFQKGEGLTMLANELLMDKIYERVNAIVTGTAPDRETLAAAASAVEEEE
ncbi:MAG: trigger factor [Anaerolineae bacterium]|nr:trigger factor [Anaerolineae bacterium]